MAFRVTQCPSCESSFNTSQRVLEAAAGKVRCGACLTVFDAADNFVVDEQAEPAESVFVSTMPADFFDPSNFLTRGALRETESTSAMSDPAEDAATGAAAPDTLEFFTAVSETLDEEHQLEPPVTDGGDGDEEQWRDWPAFTVAESETPDAAQSATATAQATQAQTAGPAPHWQALRFDAAGLAAPPWLPGAAPVSRNADTAAAGETEEEEAATATGHALDPPAQSRPDPSTISPPYSERLDASGGDAEEPWESAENEPAEAEPSVAAIRARALQAQLEDEEALDAIPQENLAALRQFTSPVELFAGSSRRWRRQTGWTALALALAVLLAVQYLWQEMPTYSQSPRLRPLYAWVCGLAGCELPTYSDITAIRSDILTVRSHPEVDNALAVNVEFRNTAPFPQPFPVMVLSFNTASNSVMALREFAPSDYLNPVLARRGLMPVMNPVQVSLEIIDPGADAVNYTLAFRRP